MPRKETRHERSARGLPLLLAGLWLGCAPAAEAPSELEELSTYLFRQFDRGEEGTLEAGLGNLADALQGVDLTVPHDERTYAMSLLDEEDVAGITRPDRDVDVGIAVALAASSAFPPADHAAVATLADLTVVEPGTPEVHDRTFVDPPDPTCFPGRECLVLRTLNDLEKDNVAMSFAYTLLEDVRWVELREPGSGEWGLVSRSWIEASAVGQQEANVIHQVYSADAFLPVDGGTVRFTTIWMEAEILGASDEVLEGSTAYDMHRTNQATETYLEGR